MGATDFYVKAKGATAKQAFDRAVAEAEEEANELARGMVNCGGEDWPTSGLEYTDPDLPEISWSPATTVLELCGGKIAECAEFAVDRHDLDEDDTGEYR